MYHIPHDSGVATHYNNYRENRRSTPSYALIPHNSNSNRRTSYAATRYHVEPSRYHSEPTRYHSGVRYHDKHITRYNSEPRLYGDSRDHVDTYQEQRYVIPYDKTYPQYRTSHAQVNRHSDGQWAPALATRYGPYDGQTARAYQYRRQVVEKPVPVCACVIT